MQTMAAVSQLRGLPSLGTQSSGLFGDVKSANFTFQSPKEVPRPTSIRASYSNFGPNSPMPPRNNEPMFQNSPVPPPPGAPPPPPPTPAQGGGAFTSEFSNRPSAAAPGAPPAGQFTSAQPPSMSPGLGSLLGPTPGLPGSPRPKPGTPRPYDPTKQKSKVMEWLTPPPPPTELLQREHFRLSPTCTCTVYFGDLSKWSVDGKSDAVIAPANKRLNTGPAVNAVLFKAAGSRLLDATQRLPDVAPQGIKAEVGDAISTRAFNLPVARVIHTVGPVYKKNEQTNVRESDESLIKAYKSALGIARKEALTYLAFPPLSCRIYGYPYSEGAEVALKTLKENCEGFNQIDIVIRNIEGYEAFIDEANKLLEVIKEKKTIKIPARAPAADSAPPPAAPQVATGLEVPPQATAPPASSTPLEVPPPPPASPPVSSFSAQGTSPPGPFSTSAPGFQSPSSSVPGFQTPTPAAPSAAPGFQNAPPAPASGFQAPAPAGSQGSYSANYQPPPSQYQPFPNAPPAASPPPPPFQNAPAYQRGPGGSPPFQNPGQGYQPPISNTPSPYQPGPPPFQQYNQPPPYQQQQFQQNPPPYAPPPPPSPRPFEQPPAASSPVAEPATPPQPAPIPPWQQKYVPPPPPPPPESPPIPPRERVSPFPPPNRPPRPPSSPTSTYEQPLF